MATKMKNGDDEAFNYLFRSKLRFIVSVPNRYEGFGSSLKELINTRSIGLIHSIRNFNLKRGFKLIIYSVRWIRQCIIRDIAVHRGAVRIPIKKVALMHKITATHRTLPQEFGREISAEELAENLQLTLSDIENIQQAKRPYYSLDAPIPGNNKASYLELLEEIEFISAEENLSHHFLHDKIGKLLRNLEPREQEIIRMRFGFNANPMTHEKKKIDLPRESIRKIEKKPRIDAEHTLTTKFS